MSAPTGLNFVWLALLALAAAILPAPASATLSCTDNPSTPSLTATIPIATIDTVGSPANRYLTPWFSAPSSGFTLIYNGCSTNNNGNISLEGHVTLPPTGRSIDGFPIFETGVPGVGIIVQGRDRNISPGVPAPSAPALGTGWATIVKGWSVYWHSSFGVRLVSTGDTIRTGTVALGRIGEIRLAENGVTNAIVPVNLVVGGSLGVISRTCSASMGSRNINVPMGTVNRGGFSGIGSTAGGGNFTVHLENCSTALNLFMTFIDGNDPGNTSDVLTLTSGTASAKGIGIRIIRQDNSQRISYGIDSALPGSTGQMPFGVTTGTTQDLAFTAAYVQTQAFIVGGIANALATIIMSYQ